MPRQRPPLSHRLKYRWNELVIETLRLVYFPDAVFRDEITSRALDDWRTPAEPPAHQCGSYIAAGVAGVAFESEPTLHLLRELSRRKHSETYHSRDERVRTAIRILISQGAEPLMHALVTRAVDCMDVEALEDEISDED